MEEREALHTGEQRDIHAAQAAAQSGLNEYGQVDPPTEQIARYGHREW